MYKSQMFHLITDKTFDHTDEAYDSVAELLSNQMNKLREEGMVVVVDVNIISAEAVPTRIDDHDYNLRDFCKIKYRGKLNVLITYVYHE